MGILAAGGISGAGQLIGGIGNFLSNSSANDRATALQDQNLQNWLAIHIPDPAQQQIALQQFVSAGTLSPQLEQAIQQSPTELGQIITDQGTKAAQQNALASLTQIGQQGGLRLQDQAALTGALNQAQQQNIANRGAIQSNYDQRGLGNSGFNLASQLQAQQGTQDINAQNSLGIAATAQNNALNAIMAAGNLGNQMQSQDWNQQAQVAQAQDAINRFNAQNKQSVGNTNVGINNSAQAANLANAQDLSNANTNLANQQNIYNQSLLQQQYQNELAKAQGEGGAYTGLSQLALGQGQNQGNFFSNLGQGVSNTATNIGNMNWLQDYLSKQPGGTNQTSTLNSSLPSSTVANSTAPNLGMYEFQKPNSSGLYY